MKWKIAGLLLTCSLLLSGCAANGSSSGGTDASTAPSAYHKINAAQAKEMIDAGGVTIVDVRRAEEYAEKHIPGAVLVPNETIGNEARDVLPEQDAVLLVYCRTGVRSKQASDQLVKLGYTNVYDFGGIMDWPYETQSGAYAP